VPLYHVFFVTPLQDVNTAKDEMEETTYRRAKHVVTENFQRVQECKVPGGVFGTTLSKTLLAISEFEGFEVSCEELDVLVDVHRRTKVSTVAASQVVDLVRCTVTLVKGKRG
jgi:galactokinase